MMQVALFLPSNGRRRDRYEEHSRCWIRGIEGVLVRVTASREEVLQLVSAGRVDAVALAARSHRRYLPARTPIVHIPPPHAYQTLGCAYVATSVEMDELPRCIRCLA
jgi:hypothetical protein